MFILETASQMKNIFEARSHDFCILEQKQNSKLYYTNMETSILIKLSRTVELSNIKVYRFGGKMQVLTLVTRGR